ncbi:oligosaccharide flippase family protein [Sporosarcina sp. E16_3]|uniref:lipopolysaccharide biosynthesis protein n=1 Tax=Sporosarcina sp. E16_3 TaxID=2789293 RepID=UPI001A9350D7|nr:oligosaccharide flippase family protein [Sporosarcina sp. E16_3]MBO0602552.1 oligosaccharide flippase family protein [Sporosarcina sp. E16_3]
MIKKLLKSDFNRNVFTLFSGTSIAQLIPLAITPILTRIYGPEDFGVFALYTSIVAILSVLATGRYELAILIPKKNVDAINIASLAITLSLMFSSLLLVILLIGGKQIIEFLNIEQLGIWVYLIPFSVLILAIYQVIYYLLNRQKLYKQMSVNKVVQQVGIGSSNIGLGFLNKDVGLIIGTLIGQFISLLLILKKLLNTKEVNLNEITIKGMRTQAKKYIDFPKYLTLAHTLNVTSSNLTIILFNKFFNATAIGHFSMTQRIMRFPLAIIGTAISDVFRQKAAEDLMTKGNCKTLYLRTLFTLVLLGIVPFVILFIISPSLFSFVFGEEWRVAGEYARLLIPMLYLQFATSPLSSLYIIMEKQKYDLVIQIFLFVLSTTGVFIGYLIFHSIEMSIILYSIAYSIIYLINGIITYKFAIVGNGKVLE